MQKTFVSASGITKRQHSRVYSVFAMLGLVAMGGCANDTVTTLEPCTTKIFTQKLQQSEIQKVDILLALDNSRSMADKQEILARTVPDLIKSLMNPRCIDENGVPAPVQPEGPMGRCPTGTRRESDPILDMHIGVISTSIGGHGADSCPDVDTMSKECALLPNTTNNDKARLLDRLDPCTKESAPTYDNKQFLAWDPTQEMMPPGESIIDDGAMGGIVPSLRNLVRGVGQIGCGYESQLESVYRFLIDPNPYESITVENFRATPVGTDNVLLDQRRAFLRPDSLVSIILLTDENDCSIKEYGQFYYAAQLRNGATAVRLPRARQECAVNPNDPCCKSCGQPAGSCPSDPTCTDPNGGDGPALLTEIEDHINLRCWDQKRRFGIDFLYPTDRYVQGFTQTQIADRDGNIVYNPLFSDLDPTDAAHHIRDPGMVFFTAIVGVPWQDIARDPSNMKKGFKDGGEMLDPIDANGKSGWDVILGDPAKGVKPLDPLMIETYEKRTAYGPNPITGDPTVDATMPLGNSINGHEWTIPNDDLQYACIFDLLPGTDRDCSNENLTSCDCTVKQNDNPLCEANPADNNSRTLQTKAKAYPGIRPLQVVRDLGSQGIVGSVCASQVDDPSEEATDYGYRTTMKAVEDRLKPALGGQCLPTQLIPDENGSVSCRVIEARDSHGQCSCDPQKGRQGIEPGTAAAQGAQQILYDPAAMFAHWDCFCEIPQSEGDELAACQNDPSDYPILNGEEIDGWCYIDRHLATPVGNPEIVARCPDNEKRIIRFVGEGEARPGSTLFISCQTNNTECNP